MNQTIKAMRLKNGFKQQYVADKIGISQGHYADMEAGRNRISVDMLECFATFYGKRSVKEIINENFLQ